MGTVSKGFFFEKIYNFKGLNSVRASVGKIDMMGGGLSEMSFLIDLWSRNTIPFCKKIQDGGDIRMGQKSFFPRKFKK
jgi:hypothetical protein